MAWYMAISKLLRETIPLHHCFVIYSVFWCGYVADRLLDIKRYQSNQLMPLRHKILSEHLLTILIAGTTIALVTIVTILLAFTSGEIYYGVLGLLLSGGYAAITQIFPRFMRTYFPRELAVSVLFSIGSLYLVWVNIEHRAALHLFVVCLLLMLIACLCNSISISYWDRESDRQLNEPSFALLVPGEFPLMWVLFSVSFSGLVFLILQFPEITSLGFVCAISLLLLCGLLYSQLKPELKFPLADYSISLPLAVYAVFT